MVVDAIPLAVIWKSVLVDEPTTNDGANPRPTSGLIENNPYGEVVPTPMLPDPRTLKMAALVEEEIAKSCVVGDEAVEVETASCANGVVLPIPMAEVVALMVALVCVHASYVERPEPVMVIGVVPMVTNEVHDAVPVQETLVVAAD